MEPKKVIAQEAAANPKFRERVSEGLDLHGLLDNQGWVVLKKHFENGREGFGKALIARQMSGEAVSQREIDYLRGCKEMAEAIFAYPEQALSNLERTATQLLERTWQQEVAAHEVQSHFIQEDA